MTDKKEAQAKENEGIQSDISPDGVGLLFGHRFTSEQIQQSWGIGPDDLDEFVNAVIKRTAKKTSKFGVSRILAGYTYLGQMITHDIVQPTCGNTRENFSAELNLGCMYPDLSVEICKKELSDSDRSIDDDGKFKLDYAEGSKSYGSDLLRGSSRALIPEGRQDENILISQLHLLWQKVHNFFVDEQVKYLTPKDREIESQASVKNARYYRARVLTTLLFQRIVIEDYLYQLLEPQVYKVIVEERTSYLIHDFPWKINGKSKVPLEFSHGAFRFGHAMVRDSYVLSKEQNRSLKKILRSSSDRAKKIHSDDEVDWRRFFDKGSNPNKAARVALQVQPDFSNVDFVSEITKQISQTELLGYFPEMLIMDDQVEKASSAVCPPPPESIEETAATDKEILLESMLRADMEASKKMPQASVYMELVESAMKFRGDQYDYILPRGGRSHEIYLPKLLQLDLKKFNRSYEVLKFSNDSFFREVRLPSGLPIDQLPIPFSVFMMREAEVLPLDWVESPSSVSFAKQDETLGPICSLIVAEVLMHSISQNDVNVFISSCELDQKIGGVSRLYMEVLQDYRCLKMVDLLNIIEY